MTSGSRRVLRSLLLLAGALASAACAQGATIDDAFRSSGSGDGGDTGDGGSGNEGGSQGDGGGNGTTSGSTSGSTSSSVTSGSTSSSSSSSSSTSASTTASSSATTSVASSSSSSGGGADCDPLNPGPECGANQTCFPEVAGLDPTCEPAGSSGVYDACFGPGECAPTTACIDVGDPFAFPCCLLFCRSTPDCGNAGDCYFFETPVYANGVEYGVCFDGISGC